MPQLLRLVRLPGESTANFLETDKVVALERSYCPTQIEPPLAVPSSVDIERGNAKPFAVIGGRSFPKKTAPLGCWRLRGVDTRQDDRA